MDTQIVITLLTISVTLLSLCIVTLLALAIIVLVKIRKITQNLDNVIQNVAAASEWLVPGKIISQIINVFRK